MSTTAIDLRTTYLGMRLSSPIIASASPATGNPLMWERLERAGAGAIVLPSLFEEQIERDVATFDATFSADGSAEAATYGAATHGAATYGAATYGAATYGDGIGGFDAGPARHVGLVERAKAQLSIPVIASINGVSPGGWVQYARHLADAGADAIELNLYDIVADPTVTGSEVERRYLSLVEDVRAEISVPLAVKIGPAFTALANVAISLESAGADGLVLFNRVFQPDIDLDRLTVVPRLVLSSPGETIPSLHWIAIVRGCEEFTGSLAGTTGVHSGPDALKLLLAGANVAMVASAVLQHGPEVIATIIASIRTWMADREYCSVDQLRGSMSHRNVADPDVFERLNYYQTLQSWVGR